METQAQKIFVWCDFTETMETAILHGLTIAAILKKELCLLNWSNKNHSEYKTLAEARMSGICSRTASSFPHVVIRYLVMIQDLIPSLERLADSYECVMLIIPKSKSRHLLPYLQYARFPFLFVSEDNNLHPIYKKVVIPVGYMKKCKDLALWASYFGRHINAVIDLIVADEKNPSDHLKVRNNLKSILNLFEKFNFPYNTIESHSPTWKIQLASLNHALGLQTGLLIIAASYDSTFIDSFLGLTEQKIIDKSGVLSVMCINSRKDFYTFCC